MYDLQRCRHSPRRCGASPVDTRWTSRCPYLRAFYRVYCWLCKIDRRFSSALLLLCRSPNRPQWRQTENSVIHVVCLIVYNETHLVGLFYDVDVYGALVRVFESVRHQIVHDCLPHVSIGVYLQNINAHSNKNPRHKTLPSTSSVSHFLLQSFCTKYAWRTSRLCWLIRMSSHFSRAFVRVYNERYPHSLTACSEHTDVIFGDRTQLEHLELRLSRSRLDSSEIQKVVDELEESQRIATKQL